ncbi:tyrosine-type recombinase/integrase [Sulfitobacter sp. JBTF-M27]|uniref:Tyrosine-type recombinase/integrase n=1 Tax=Sulfitobacter sediminilitoris TaxID=2698830 RepID=A0A6P0CIA6_9RHOB|nr:tyrosine-type recombinase/integrase [Sulfitobacter sediminilitoris]NEK25140.1 tyrosine-type recombinase/integrase [Sulfitobacter sediminilitoris]
MKPIEPLHFYADWRHQFQRLEGAYAPSTMRAYYRDVQAYEDWCGSTKTVPFPATTAQVCRFLEDQGKEKAPSTVQRRLYAIRKVHRLLALPDPTYDEDINLTFRRVRRRRTTRPRQARGLNWTEVQRFIRVQPDTPWGLRNAAMLSLGYELLTRRAELIALRDGDLTWREDGTLRVLIRRSKTDQEGNGRIAFTSTHTTDRVKEWVSWRGDATSWLFCPIYQEQVVDRSLSTTSVKALIKTAALNAGYPPEEVRSFSGHSLRVGAAQDLLKKGFDTSAIMRAGGWKSVNTLARYLEYAEHNVWV